MGQKVISGDLNVTGAIKHNGSEISYGIPTVTIELSQVVSQDPIQVQLTNDQYNVFANNKQVIIDMSAVGQPSVVWKYANEDSDYIYFGCPATSSLNNYYQIDINKSTKEAEYHYGEKWVNFNTISEEPDSAGLLMGFGIQGDPATTRNLPILTTAPSSDNSEGGLIIVVLSQEPSSRLSGYLYIITASQGGN